MKTPAPTLNFDNDPRIRVPWKPHAKQRARVAKGHAYTPAATRNAEDNIRRAFLDSVGGEYAAHEGPIQVEIELHNDFFYIDITPVDEHTQRKLRGDADNYAKTILDSLNGIAYDDDKQIRILRMEKA